MKELRKLYEETFGKRPFNGWSREKLLTMLKEKGVEEYKTEDDLKPPLPEGAKTGKEAIDELLESKKEVTVEVKKFTKEIGYDILDSLWKSLGDGRYRAKVNTIRAKEIKSSKVFKEELLELYAFVYEGELKAKVRNYIDQF